ncbi:hypothetical protein BDV59DRAFT_174171 [Aspergillus ambiguus]|uniref:Zn(II)2Cys6 transcription factor domain-containing protein n=1 Tax=Aspergillus ambiguus TaxID=176160 RepID=UPI003CCD8A91
MGPATPIRPKEGKCHPSSCWPTLIRRLTKFSLHKDRLNDTARQQSFTKWTKMPQKGHTRSRAGCLTCRKRHLRCDEQRPSCQTCLASNRSCSYPLAVIPLRDRRMLQKNALPPGQLPPWAFAETQSLTRWRLPKSTIVDPFDTLPVKMPFKSQELYRYFYQTGAAFVAAPLDPKNDCVALATLDEHALRSTILIASVHYSWNTGDLRAYESVYLLHKVESIRLINIWLDTYDSKRFVVCVRQILTICLAEACLANLAAAGTHLDGVMALFDTHDAMTGTAGDTVGDLDRELANHYLLLTSCFVLALKSRLDDFIMFRAAQGLPSDNNDGSSPDQAIKLYQKWHGMEYAGLDTRLKAMRLFPYFFSPPPTNVPRSKTMVVDALPIIECLASITDTLDQVQANRTSEHMHRVWNDGGPTRLLLALVTSHVSCFLTSDEPKNNAGGHPVNSGHRHQTSWSGIAAVAELYMHSVLGIMNAGAPIECRLLYRILIILQRDVEDTRHAILTYEHGSLSESLWVWKVFTGVMAIARSPHTYELITRPTAIPDPRARCSCPCQGRLKRVYQGFRNCARSWSVVSGTTRWEDVEHILTEIAWPCVLPRGGRGFAADAWARVLL